MKRIWAVALLIVTGCGGGAPAKAAEDGVTSDAIKLAWTAPGDDSTSGRAAVYDLRYWGRPITAANFDSAARFAATPPPSVAGALDSVVVSGLAPLTDYWFALKTADEVGNWSLISNVVMVTTAAAADTTRPAWVRDLRRRSWFGVVPVTVRR